MGFRIELTQQQLDWCKELAFKRSGSMNHSDTVNSQNFLNKKPAWYRHYIGVIGELVYSIYTGFAVDDKTIGIGDDGTDFPESVQVKSSDTEYKPNLMFPVSQFYRKIAKTYILVWIKIPFAEIIGNITRDKVIEVKEIKNYGYGETYFVSNKHLLPIE